METYYNPNQRDAYWYQQWLVQGFFKARVDPCEKPYTIIMPPPNITGMLHMGHVLNNTIQDVLIRRARMQGLVACWVPGLDHASIATEAKVVGLLAEKGLNKKEIGREAFLSYAWQWKEKYGGIILEQIKQLGASCDWDRLRFTLDPSPAAAVRKVFITLYQQGLIYQGKRMIHWDPVGRTALADDEVNYKSVDSQLYYIAYPCVESGESVIVATTRPETIFGDAALCVHPDDQRYQHLHGKYVRVPIIQRVIPIIADSYVVPTFGTGCLKVTPAHDPNDYLLGQKYGLPIIDIFHEDGTLAPSAQYYVGQDRFVVREKVVHDLQRMGNLLKVESYTNQVGFSERTNAVVEPRLSTQWFVRMQQLAQPALQHVLDGTIQFHPPKFKHMYQAWLENVQDWCISRQLWWGHPIPAFYLPNGAVLVAENQQEALEKARLQYSDQVWTAADLRPDEDVLDTWFSSWLWPITVFDGLADVPSQDREYFYPTDVVVTAPEIIFFWIARMIMAGYAFAKEPPFKHVYFTGIVRDQLGRKMSKSLGNSPDPLDLIAAYGADAVRVGMLLSSPAGNDLLFDRKLCEQGRNFAHKLWNATRLVKGWQVASLPHQPNEGMAIAWMEAMLHQSLVSLETCFNQFRLSDGLMVVYTLIWDDFCSWYLEMVKPPYGQPIAPAVYEATCNFLATLVKMLHPFMPFITEEIWHQLQPRNQEDCVIIASWPQPIPYQASLLQEASYAFSLITEVRNVRIQRGLSGKVEVPLCSSQQPPTWFVHFQPYIYKLAGAIPISLDQVDVDICTRCYVGNHLFYLVVPQPVSGEQEIGRLRKELDYYEGFLAVIVKKLDNEKFIAHAPESVLAMERKKQGDTLAKIDAIKEQLAVWDQS
jgi:valyl-tRNA synthetase